MNKIYICNQIKSEILSVAKPSNIKPYNLGGNIFLYELGYREKVQCEQLIAALQTIADEYHITKQINELITTDFTVNQCIRLLIN